MKTCSTTCFWTIWPSFFCGGRCACHKQRNNLGASQKKTVNTYRTRLFVLYGRLSTYLYGCKKRFNRDTSLTQQAQQAPAPRRQRLRRRSRTRRAGARSAWGSPVKVLHGIGRPRPVENPPLRRAGVAPGVRKSEEKEGRQRDSDGSGTGKSCEGMDPPWTPRLTIPQRPLPSAYMMTMI